jgi:hypothetical protein
MVNQQVTPLENSLLGKKKGSTISGKTELLAPKRLEKGRMSGKQSHFGV